MKVEYSEIEFDEDDLPPKPKNKNEFEKIRKKNQKPSTDIFLRFWEEQENKINEYIHERELRNNKIFLSMIQLLQKETKLKVKSKEE